MRYEDRELMIDQREAWAFFVRERAKPKGCAVKAELIFRDLTQASPPTGNSGHYQPAACVALARAGFYSR